MTYPQLIKNIITKVIVFSLIFIPCRTFSMKLMPRNPMQSTITPAVLQVQNTTAKKLNAEFNVPVKIITNGNKVCSVKANLSFSPSKLEVVSLTKGPIFTTEAVKGYSNQNGIISYTLGAPGCTTSDTVLYTVKFRAKNTGAGSIRFTSTNVVSVDNTGMPYSIPAKVSGTTIWITGNSQGGIKITSFKERIKK